MPVVERLQMENMLSATIVHQDHIIIGDRTATPLRRAGAKEVASLMFRHIGKLFDECG